MTQTWTFFVILIALVVAGLFLRSRVPTSDGSATASHNPAQTSNTGDVLGDLLREHDAELAFDRAVVRLEAEFLATVDELSAKYDRAEHHLEQAWVQAKTHVPTVALPVLSDPDQALSAEVVGNAKSHRAWKAPHEWK